MRVLKHQSINYNYISTGQHKGTIDEILKNFDIKKPDYVLYDGKDVTSVIQMFAWATRIAIKTLRQKKQIFRNDKNGIVLVHGDTFSRFWGCCWGRLPV